MAFNDTNLEANLTTCTSKVRGSGGYWHMTYRDLELMDVTFGWVILVDFPS